MEQRMSMVTLGVADLKRSKEFYERLGWRRSMAKAEGVVCFQAGAMALALFPRHELAKDANISADGHGFSGMSLAYNARNRQEVDSVLAEAKAAGARLLKPAQEAFWGGYSGYFSDPDGFLWEVAWNPYFPMAEDGSIQIPDQPTNSLTQRNQTEPRPNGRIGTVRAPHLSMSCRLAVGEGGQHFPRIRWLAGADLPGLRLQVLS